MANIFEKAPSFVTKSAPKKWLFVPLLRRGNFKTPCGTEASPLLSLTGPSSRQPFRKRRRSKVVNWEGRKRRPQNMKAPFSIQTSRPLE